MPKSIPIAEAKAKLSKWIRDAESGRPVVITRHGRPVAALVPAEDLEQLQRLRAAGPQGGLASVAGGWKDSDELGQRLRSSRRRGRRVAPALD